jgi:ABC-type transporter lipoprotein component MlaA
LKTLDTKQHILDEAGFSYNFDRKIYVNRKTKKIFSVEFVEDNDEKTLEESIREETSGKKWRFYFNSNPPEGVKREIEAVLG